MNQYYFIKPLASPSVSLHPKVERDARELTIHLKKQTEQTPFSILDGEGMGMRQKNII